MEEVKQLCRYELESDPTFSCRHIEERQGLCIFHLPKLSPKEKSAQRDRLGEVLAEEERCRQMFEELIRAAEDDLEDVLYFHDFRGFSLPEINLAGREFTKKVSFHNASFRGDVGFENAGFDWGVNFAGATFDRAANFKGARLRQRCSFKGANFRKESDFRTATFKGGGDPRAASAQENSLRQPDTPKTDFSGTVFEGDAAFGSAVFEGETAFSDATFKESVGFGGAAFSGLDFGRARFVGKANFGRAVFGKEADFSGAAFEGVADFGHTTFEETARFNEAIFDDDVYFGGSHTHRCFAGKCQFKLLRLGKEAEVVFERADLRQATFLNTNLERITFRDVDWFRPRAKLWFWAKRKQSLWDELNWDSVRAPNRSDYEKVADNYGQLVIQYEQRRDFNSAEDFHIGELEMQRRMKGDIPGWPRLGKVRGWLNAYSIYGLSSNYGTSYVQAFLMLVALILLFSVGFLFGGFSHTRESGGRLGQSVEYNLLPDSTHAPVGPLRLAEDYLSAVSLSLSIITFQKDRFYEPMEGVSRLLLYAAVFALTAQTGLLLLTIRRRFRR